MVKSSRVMIRYAEEGGIDKDGLIEMRKGAKDLDLGNNSHAQVRINVNNTLLSYFFVFSPPLCPI